jgi:hypothetical protein
MSYTEPYARDINADGKVDEADIDELLKRLREREEQRA